MMNEYIIHCYVTPASKIKKKGSRKIKIKHLQNKLQREPRNETVAE